MPVYGSSMSRNTFGAKLEQMFRDETIREPQSSQKEAASSLVVRDIGKHKLAQNNVNTPDDVSKFFEEATLAGADGMCTFHGTLLVTATSPFIQETIANTGLQTMDVALHDGSHVIGIKPQLDMDINGIASTIISAYEISVINEMVRDGALQKFDGITLCNVPHGVRGETPLHVMSDAKNLAACQVINDNVVNVYLRTESALAERMSQRYENNIRGSGGPDIACFRFNSKQEAVDFLNEANREAISLEKETIGTDVPTVDD